MNYMCKKSGLASCELRWTKVFFLYWTRKCRMIWRFVNKTERALFSWNFCFNTMYTYGYRARWRRDRFEREKNKDFFLFKGEKKGGGGTENWKINIQQVRSPSLSNTSPPPETPHSPRPHNFPNRQVTAPARTDADHSSSESPVPVHSPPRPPHHHQ